MGGLGSGRDWFWNKKKPTEDFFSLNINQLNREGYLRSGYKAVTVRFPSSRRSCTFSVTWTPCNYGSQRPWFRCPGCSKQVGKLYSPTGDRSYHCRRCHDLTYRSCQVSGDAVSGACNRIVKLKRKCKASWLQEAPFAPLPDKPKGMHWRTYKRLTDEIVEATKTLSAASSKQTLLALEHIDRLAGRVGK